LAFLPQIETPQDLRALTPKELVALCREIREFFIDSVLQNGGHFSANLGVVELTVALHYLFDFQEHKLVWDVGHQAYIHKLLTGRKESFASIRKKGGLSGFPKLEESEYDHFGTGHSSTSISAVMGMAESALLNGLNRKHIAVIGDGSLTGGMVFEALNNLGISKADVLVIVNDNEMGIDPNLGAVNQHLNVAGKQRPNFFENLNIPYFGPIDGHNLDEVLAALEHQKTLSGPRVLHIKTLKGKGYEPAEKAQTDWHSVSYVKITPDKKEETQLQNPKFQDVFGNTLVELAKKDKRVVGVTPAMPSGCSMKFLMDEMPERVFDVGIAEQHAVTFSAGLALDGKRVFCNIYSSFAQRAYDQIIHDVALQNIPVIFCLDRAGAVGADGPTHHGMFDLAYLLPIPNLTILSPLNKRELQQMMYWAKDYTQGPVVIRYPRGRVPSIKSTSVFRQKAQQLNTGNKLAVISLGEIGYEVQQAIQLGSLENDVTHYDARFAKPLDKTMLENVFNHYQTIVTVEDGCILGGFGEHIRAASANMGYEGQIQTLGYPDEFVEHGSIVELRKQYGLDAESLLTKLKTALKHLKIRLNSEN
jgi:1-deoxy-D-xylulose-5-phosphate synthase